jgi:hypothetical protein
MSIVSTVGGLKKLIATMPDRMPIIGSFDGEEAGTVDVAPENRRAYFQEDSLPETHMLPDCLVIEVTF